MKGIGEAVQNQSQVNGTDTVTIGIATWGIINSSLQQKMIRTKVEITEVTNKKHLETQTQSLFLGLPKNSKEKVTSPSSFLRTLETDDLVHGGNGVELEYNHSHFLLVDSGVNEFGGEIELRGQLEGTISKHWETEQEQHTSRQKEAYEMQIPVVCIAIEGGPGTIQTVYEAVRNGIPVIIVANTGRAANLMAQVFKENKKLSVDDAQIFTGCGITMSEDKLEKAVREINFCLDNSKLLNVYERQHEIKEAIFDAIKKAKTNPNDQLRLALNWNRVDMFDRNNLKLTTMVCQNPHDGSSNALRYALVHNRPKFVKMIMENVDIKKYLTEKELEHLYNAEPQPLLKRLLRETTNKNGNYEMKHIENLLRKLTGNAFDVCHKDRCQTDYGCMQVLLIYSVLNNFNELADYFWELGREAVSSALAVSKLYKSMAALRFKDTKLKESMLENAKKYERRACGILTICQENPGKCGPADLLLRVIPNWGHVTCLNLAEAAENIKFLSHPAVSELLNEKWQGGLMEHNLIPTRFGHITEPFVLLACSVFPFLIPFLVRFKRNRHWLVKIMTFFVSPRSVFRHNFVSYISFVLLFSYNLLWEPLDGLSWSDWLLFTWMFSMATEEIRQALEWEANTFCLRLKHWWSGNWNKFDVLAISLFIIGTSLRYVSNEKAVEAARIILAFDLFILYFRFLEYLTFIKRIGPKVIMIGKMVIDLVFFMCIAFTLLVGYGITAHVILYPHVKQPSAVFKSVLKRPYFQIYGELFLEEIGATPDDGDCSFNESSIEEGAEPCARFPDYGLVLLAMYLLFSNVLLLNLLIAMFSNTFQAVQAKTDLHWRFQRYKLTKEYLTKPIFASPLSVLSNLCHLLAFIFLAASGYKDRYLPFFHQFGLRKQRFLGDEDEDGGIYDNYTEPLLLWEEAKAKQFSKTQQKEKQQ